MKDVEDFLLKNGFVKLDEKPPETGLHYKNDKCLIIYHWHGIIVKFTYSEESECIHSEDIEIFWLIGVLTWYDLIDKDYKK